MCRHKQGVSGLLQFVACLTVKRGAMAEKGVIKKPAD